MKKILVVLLILAVAGGVFAQQGEWSLGASAQIGTRLNLDPDPNSSDDKALIRGTGYFRTTEWWSGIGAALNLGYTRGILNIGVDLDTTDALGLGVAADGDNYRFYFYTNPAAYFGGSSSDADFALNSQGYGDRTYAGTVGRLWGIYDLLGGLVTLEAAYNSRDTEYWYSDKTGMYGTYDYALHNDLNTPTAIGYNWTAQNSSAAMWSDADTFTSVDHHTYLLTGLNLANLSLGLIIPNVFATDLTNSFDNGFGDDGQTPVLVQEAWSHSDGVYFVDDVLKRIIFGAKFDMSPIEFAAQFLMKDYGVYFGGKFFAGPVTVGLSFSGIFGSEDGASSYMKFGGGITYNTGVFGAGVRAYYGKADSNNDTSDYQSIIGVEPAFSYNVIPSHLSFFLDAGFYFTNDVANNEDDKNVVWAVQPALLWNFLGTGAPNYGNSGSSYWAINTGMIFRYRLVSETSSALDIIFKFGI